jgi:hypothetical protein
MSCSADQFTRFEGSQSGVTEESSLLGYEAVLTAIGTAIKIKVNLVVFIVRV